MSRWVCPGVFTVGLVLFCAVTRGPLETTGVPGAATKFRRGKCRFLTGVEVVGNDKLTNLCPTEVRR